MAKADLETGVQSDEPAIGDESRAFDDVVRAVQLMVSETTGMSAALTVPTRTVDRSTWSSLTLTGLEPVLGALAAALARTDTDATEPDATQASSASSRPTCCSQ